MPHRKRRSRPQRRAPRWLKPTLFYGGYGLVVIVLVGTLLSSMNGTWSRLFDWFDPGNKIDLSYLPPDANCVIRIHPAELWTSDLAESYRSSATFREGLLPSWEVLGLKATDIDTATFGGVGVRRQLAEMHVGQAVVPAFITVLRTSRPVADPPRSEYIVESQAAVHQGETYYRLTIAAEDGQRHNLAVFLPDPDTIVLGSEDLILRAIEVGDVQERRRELDFVNSRHQVLIVFVGKIPPANSSDDSLQRVHLTATYREMIDAVDRGANSYSLGLTILSNELVLEALCEFADADAAQRFRSGFASIIQAGLDAVSRSTDLALSNASDRTHSLPLFRLAQQSLQAIDIECNGTMVQIHGNVSLEGEVRRGLRQHAQVMAPFQLVLEHLPRLMLGLNGPGDS